MSKTNPLTFNALIKFDAEYNLWVAHCLELDLVATSDTPEQATKDLGDIVVAQVSYAIANDNIAYLLRAAPKQVWLEFLQAKAAADFKARETAVAHHWAIAAPIPAALPLSSVGDGIPCYV